MGLASNNPVKFSIKNISCGCADVEWIINDVDIKFYASYMGRNPLSLFIAQLAEYEKYYGSDDEDSDDNSFQGRWHDEPGILDYEVRVNLKTNSANINIDIRRDIAVLPNEEEISKAPIAEHYNTTVNYSDLKNAIIDAAIEALNEYGLIGYSSSWCDGNDNFPIASLLRLKGIEPTLVNVDSYKSKFSQEVELLGKLIENYEDKNV